MCNRYVKFFEWFVFFLSVVLFATTTQCYIFWPQIFLYQTSEGDVVVFFFRYMKTGVITFIMILIIRHANEFKIIFLSLFLAVSLSSFAEIMSQRIFIV